MIEAFRPSVVVETPPFQEKQGVLFSNFSLFLSQFILSLLPGREISIIEFAKQKGWLFETESTHIVSLKIQKDELFPEMTEDLK